MSSSSHQKYRTGGRPGAFIAFGVVSTSLLVAVVLTGTVQQAVLAALVCGFVTVLCWVAAVAGVVATQDGIELVRLGYTRRIPWGLIQEFEMRIPWLWPAGWGCVKLKDGRRFNLPAVARRSSQIGSDKADVVIQERNSRLYQARRRT